MASPAGRSETQKQKRSAVARARGNFSGGNKPERPRARRERCPSRGWKAPAVLFSKSKPGSLKTKNGFFFGSAQRWGGMELAQPPHGSSVELQFPAPFFPRQRLITPAHPLVFVGLGLRLKRGDLGGFCSKCGLCCQTWVSQLKPDYFTFRHLVGYFFKIIFVVRTLLMLLQQVLNSKASYGKVMAAPSLKVFKAKLDRAWSNLG